jgi:hypothetical protein
MRNLTASDRSALIKLASSLPEGSPEKKAILAALQGSSKAASGLSDFDYEVTSEAKDYLFMLNDKARSELRPLLNKMLGMDNPRLKPFIKEIVAKYKEFTNLVDELEYSFEKELDAARALDRKSQRRRR